MLEHPLSSEQIRIYDAYASAFEIIHNNLNAALEASNITGEGGKSYNKNAKSAARSAFESNKQRFFAHLITAMKAPSLIKAIEADLEAGHASVIQIVSTNEALLERRLAEIPTAEWNDLSVDITPREYVLDYLAHSFPTQLFEVYSDEDGNLQSRPALDEDGNPIQSREAIERREKLIEHLASLPAVQGALDQIIQRFGTEMVAEVTGRSRRIVAKANPDGSRRLCVETAQLLPISGRRGRFRGIRSGFSSSPMPVARAGAITPSVRRRTSACASITCWNPAGRRITRSRGWGAPTGPIRHSRRCSVRGERCEGREAVSVDDRPAP